MFEQGRNGIQETPPSINLFTPERLQPNTRHQEKIIAAVTRRNPLIMQSENPQTTTEERKKYLNDVKTKQITDIDYEHVLSAINPIINGQNEQGAAEAFTQLPRDINLNRRVCRVISLLTKNDFWKFKDVIPKDLQRFIQQMPTAIDFERSIPHIINIAEMTASQDDVSKKKGQYLDTIDELGNLVYGKQWQYLKQIRLLEEEAKKMPPAVDRKQSRVQQLVEAFAARLKKEPKPPKKAAKNPQHNITRRRLLSVAVGAAVGAIAEPYVRPLVGQTTTAAPPSPSPTFSPAPTESTNIFTRSITTKLNEAVLSPEKTNILDEFLKPFIEEAMRRRSERAKNNPEYARRVDAELNADRVNFLLYGYGDTLENPPENPNLERGEMGSHSVFSYNLKTKKFDIISLTHDIRAPEIERFLQQQGKEAKPTKLNGAFGIGGFALQAEAIEDATGFAVDFQMVMPDTFIKDFTDNAFGTVDVDVPFSIDLYPFYHEGKLYPEGHLEKGKQKMDGIKTMQFLKAWSKTHSPEHERNIRKHLFIKSLIKQAKANKTNIGFLLKTFSFLREQEAKQTVKVDFDLGKLLLSPQTLIGLATKAIGQSDDGEMFQTDKTMYVVDPYSGGPEGGVVWVTRSESPKIKEELEKGIVNDPTMVVPHTENANPYSDDLITDYWSSVRKLVRENLSSPLLSPSPTATRVLPPGFSGELPLEAPIGVIVYPDEITDYNKVRERLKRLVGSHTSVLTESYFTRDLAALPKQKREQALDAIATAHAKALIEYYGSEHAIIGLDPGHGGSDIGSSGKTPEGEILYEKGLTWEIAQLVGAKLHELSDGRYDVIMLRPKNPQDIDLDGDGIISPIERIQKRKALLILTEEQLRPNPADRGKNILYLSIHLNGSTDPRQKGTETFFPNKTGESSPILRAQSKAFAITLQQYLVKGLNAIGIPTVDRGAKEDPDKRTPGSNSQDVGPYVATGSGKLLRDLAAGQGKSS